MKAEEKSTTAGLLGKLHYGVSEFLDEATCLLNPRTSELKDISARLLVCTWYTTCTFFFWLLFDLNSNCGWD